MGTLIRVQYDLLGDLQGANNVSGGVATFLKNSEHAELDHYDYMQYRYPRTLVGYTKDGDVMQTVLIIIIQIKINEIFHSSPLNSRNW